MTTKRVATGLLQFRLAMTVLLFGISCLAFAAEQPIRVVATLSTFADLVKQIGGEHVQVSHVAPARFNPHFIEPRPSDVLKVKKAQLFVHAGLDLELWRGPLLDAAGNADLFPGRGGELDLSRGVSLLEVPDRPVTRLMGDIHIYGNPHYWLDPENVRVMVQAICDKLCEVDLGHEQKYHRNLKNFLDHLDQEMPTWRSRLAAHQGQELIGYHNEWVYLMRFANLKMEQFLEPKPGIPPSPKQLSFLEGYMRQHQVKVVAQSTYFPRAASNALAKRTGARVATLAQNIGEIPEAGDYFAFMDYNTRQLAQALEGMS